MTFDLMDRISPEDRETIKGFTSEIPVAVGGLAKAFGLKVLKSSFKPKVSGQIGPSKDSPSGYEIKVNRYEKPERQRFTIAHEIAHYLLHREHIGNGIVDNVLYRSNLSNRLEAEANKLAAEIIMPKKLMKLKLSEYQTRTSTQLAEELASDFRVSLPAMEIRLGLR